MKYPFRNRVFPGVLAAVGSLTLLLAACSGDAASAPATSAAAGASSAGGGSQVDATESEFKIELSSTSVKPGPVTFHVKNAGTTVHEFVVLKTDAAQDALPLASGGGEVDEDAGSLTAVDEVEDLEPGATADLAVTLDPGHYVVICNLPAHYPSGMHATLTVEP